MHFRLQFRKRGKQGHRIEISLNGGPIADLQPSRIDIDPPVHSQNVTARGVQFVKGSDFLLEGGESSLRLAYSGVTPEQIDEGISRLAEAYHSLSGTPAAA